MRKQGHIPAIIYNRDAENLAIALPAHEVEVALERGTHILAIEIDGKAAQYLIRAVQYDYLGTTPIHVDLAMVNLDEVVEVNVAIELRGTPAGISDGGILDQVMNGLVVRCKVADIPGLIRPSVSKLGLDESLTVADLELPEGVEATVEGSEVIAVVRLLAEEPEAEEEAEAEEGSTEPEVIGRDKKEEGEEGEAS
jgi:large subunit ribosomal protein L25